MFIIPMPMWVFALIIVAHGRDGGRQSLRRTSHTRRTSAAPCSDSCITSGACVSTLAARPELDGEPAVAGPSCTCSDPDSVEPDSTETRVNEILKKIQEHGQNSLTRRERRILEQASKEYQRRRQMSR